MTTYEKHKEENLKKRIEDAKMDTPQAYGLRERARERRKNTVRKMNNWWLWFGVLVLIVILVWWLFSLGIFEDSTGIINGN